MKTEYKNLTGQESLNIITEMIETAKGNVKDRGFYFLLWGWIVIITNLGHYLLHTFTEFKHPYYIWAVSVFVGLIVSVIYGYIRFAVFYDGFSGARTIRIISLQICRFR